jgi:GxxExxY protein
MENIDKLIKTVIGAAYTVHNTLGAGFLEKIYERSLRLELKKQNVNVEVQYPIPVHYAGEKVGDYYADLLVEGCLIVEIKAIESLNPAHEKQLVNYLTATNTDDGLLINFGSSVQVKRKYRVYSKGSDLPK